MKKREVSKISSTYTDFLGRPAKWIVMTLFAIAVIGPLYWLFTNAIKVKADYLSSPPVIIPTRVTFENFVSIFKNDGVGKGLYNSIVITVVSTILASSFGSLAAYSLTKGRLRKPIRSVLACKAKSGVCAKCYGINLAVGQPVNPGEAVGVIAAQSIGEPGTQLTMRTFHTGGIAGDDITQGLPRVEELFEARKPKKAATLAEISGVVTIEESKRTTVKTVNIVNAETGDMRSYQLASSSGIRVTDGQEVEQGFQLNEGSLNPHDILRVLDPRAVHDYEIKEVQKVYRQQGVDINDKHIEVIVRQMMRKVRVEDAGDAEVLPGSVMDLLEFEDYNQKVQDRIDAGEEGLRLAVAEPTLMGITKASLATDSWMSAASFQETTRVLTDAAIKGKVDPLMGLKENVIIGKLIPAGSGMSEYCDGHYEQTVELD